MEDKYFEKDGYTFVRQFPLFEQSKIQQDLTQMLSICDNALVEWSRRLGKTTCLAINFFNRLQKVDDGEFFKYGQVSVCSMPSSMEIHAKFAGTYMLLPFGGIENIKTTIDRIFIPLPNEYREYLIKGLEEHTLSNRELDWWFNDKASGGQNLIQVIEDEWFVKLFKSDFGRATTASSSNPESVFKAQLYNGAEIYLVGANHFFEKTVRSLSVYNAWFEELATMSKDFTQSLIPAIKAKGGFFQASYTPPDIPEPKSSWLYKRARQPIEIWEEIGLRKITRYGIDHYLSEESVEIPRKVKDSNGIESYITHTHTVRNLIAIGQFTRAVWHSHWESQYLSNVLADVDEEIKIQFNTNDKGEYLLDEEGAPTFNLTYTGRKRANRSIKIDSWHREFQMGWEPLQKYKIFTKFSDLNILPASSRQKFEVMPSMVGFDAGIGIIDEERQVIVRPNDKTSISILVWVARISRDQWVVYKEKLINYDYDKIGEEFFRCAYVGLPVIYDYAISKRQGTSRGMVFSDLNQIIRSRPGLSQKYRKYNRCIIPCYKDASRTPVKDKLTKIQRFNSYFEQSDWLEHPLTKEKGASRLYILDDCLQSIDYFKNCARELDKNGDDKIDNRGNVVTTKIRTDAFDALSYPIDTFLFSETRRTEINGIWKSRNDYHSSSSEEGQVANRVRQVLTVGELTSRMMKPQKAKMF